MNFGSFVSSIKKKSAEAIASINKEMQFDDEESNTAAIELETDDEKKEENPNDLPLPKTSSMDIGSLMSTMRKKSAEALDSIASRSMSKDRPITPTLDNQGLEPSLTDHEQDTPNASSSSAQRSVGSVVSIFKKMGTTILQGAEEMYQTIEQGTENPELSFLKTPDSIIPPPAEPVSEVTTGKAFRLRLLREQKSTYIDPPVELDDFQEWKKDAKTQKEMEKDIEHHRMHYPVVKQLAEELVPEFVNEIDFWSHYLFKLLKFNQQEDRREQLLENATADDDEEELGWDNDEEDEKVDENEKVNENGNKNEKKGIETETMQVATGEEEKRESNADNEVSEREQEEANDAGAAIDQVVVEEKEEQGPSIIRNDTDESWEQVPNETEEETTQASLDTGLDIETVTKAIVEAKSGINK